MNFIRAINHFVEDAPEERCCGSCRYFLHEDIDGFGWCEELRLASNCSCGCDKFEEDKR